MKYRVSSAIAAGCVALGALSACGSSGKTAASATTAATGTTAGGTTGTTTSGGKPASGTPILIGQLAPVNAPFYSIPDQVAAVKAAIGSINASGGVDGRPLKLDFCNEDNDPNKTIACARKLVSDGVVATVSDQSVTNGPVMTQIFAAGHVAQIGLIPTVTSEMNSPTDFPLGNSVWTYVGVSGASVSAVHAKRVVQVHPDNVGAFWAAIDNAVQKSGSTVVNTVLLPLTAITSYTPYAEQIIKSNPDLVIAPTTDTEAIGLLNAVRQLGSKVPFAINDAALSDSQISQLGASADGSFIFSSTPWIHDTADYPGMNAFIASMNAEAAKGDKDANLTTVRPIAVTSWLATYGLKQVLSQMATAGQTITASNVLPAFSKATNLNMMGIIPNWSPSITQKTVPGYSNISVTGGYLLHVVNGQQVLEQKNLISIIPYF